jgi:hypothetical protein
VFWSAVVYESREGVILNVGYAMVVISQEVFQRQDAEKYIIA